MNIFKIIEDNHFLYLSHQILLQSVNGRLVPRTRSSPKEVVVKGIKDAVYYAVTEKFHDGDQIVYDDVTYMVQKGVVVYSPQAEKISSIQMQDVVGEYDVPDSVEEWNWIEKNASFSHRYNGQSGVWDFILNLSLTFKDVPPKLLPVIEKAKASNISYLLFHQGT